MVIEEVSVLQTQLDIEKSCRENAEALATKLNCENRKLKYLSLSSRASLDELLPSISDCAALEADGAVDDATVDGAADPSPDALTQRTSAFGKLRAAVGGLLEEKKSLACQLLERQRHLEELSAQAQADRAQLEQLRQTVEQQSKTLKRFNRVSMMATQEFEGMKEQLDLEQSLRVKAESYAHEMLVKQKEANRQSMLLLQSAEPSVQLLKALEDLAAASKTLEEERLQHQQEVQPHCYYEEEVQPHFYYEEEVQPPFTLRRRCSLTFTMRRRCSLTTGRLLNGLPMLRSPDEGGMSQVSSSDSLSGRPVSSDSGREPDGPPGLSAPPPPAGPRLSPDRRGSGPGPAVARRKSSDAGRERRSSSSLSGKHTPPSPVNGCVLRRVHFLCVGEEERASSNGVDPAEPREAGPSPEPLNGRLDAAC
ncbi:unnamed protein product [Menidia menidia]|uniref:(Atlantic silverside) hypothetical protein n=1 Tax=Menidia menidia TaxID=238744 RepID=A0A8S4BLR2_9TELE|nr:unnamed protein product [Menidia menidia]